MNLSQITRESAAVEVGRRHPYMALYGRMVALAVLAGALLAGLGWLAIQVKDAVGGKSLDVSLPDLTGLGSSLGSLTSPSLLWLVPVGLAAVAWWFRPSARLNRQIRKF